MAEMEVEWSRLLARVANAEQMVALPFDERFGLMDRLAAVDRWEDAGVADRKLLESWGFGASDEIVEARVKAAVAARRSVFGGQGSGPRPGHRSSWYDRPSRADRVSADLVSRLMDADAGFTVELVGGSQPTSGFAVAVRGHSSITPAAQFFAGTPGREVGRAILRKYVRDKRELLSEPGMHLGAWHDPKHDEIVLDPSQVFDNREEAVAAGRLRNQQVIADLGAIHEGRWDDAFIDTGGTGDREDGLGVRLPVMASDESESKVVLSAPPKAPVDMDDAELDEWADALFDALAGVPSDDSE
jgi:hypothetical protein